MPPKKRKAAEDTTTSPSDRITEALAIIERALDDITSAAGGENASPNLASSMDIGRQAHAKFAAWAEGHIHLDNTLACRCGKDIDMIYPFASCFHRACLGCVAKTGVCCSKIQSMYRVVFEKHDTCPVCLLSKPWMDILECGHTICPQCYPIIRRDHGKCPICRQRIVNGVIAQYPTIPGPK
ncbi:hypothetical protein CcaCcLH18_10125 [Colletotrichum camelliae]|nr:hypothetical protein CcaCcLH18_10125 [Colletotrichum camelliae]